MFSAKNVICMNFICQIQLAVAWAGFGLWQHYTRPDVFLIRPLQVFPFAITVLVPRQVLSGLQACTRSEDKVL